MGFGAQNNNNPCRYSKAGLEVARRDAVAASASSQAWSSSTDTPQWMARTIAAPPSGRVVEKVGDTLLAAREC